MGNASQICWAGRNQVCRYLLELPAVARSQFEPLLRDSEDRGRFEETLAGARVSLIWWVRSVASGESSMSVRMPGPLGLHVDACLGPLLLVGRVVVLACHP